MRPADDPMEMPEIWPLGTIVKGEFTIEKLLGTGGFGTVYLARHRFLGKSVIKRLHPHYASDREFARKFVNEGVGMRRLKTCSHIVGI